MTASILCDIHILSLSVMIAFKLYYTISWYTHTYYILYIYISCMLVNGYYIIIVFDTNLYEHNSTLFVCLVK